MDSGIYLYNIEGCFRYKDVGTARDWLARANRELNADQFVQLLGSVHSCAFSMLTKPGNQALTEPTYQLLAEFDPLWDALKRSKFEQNLRRYQEYQWQIEAEAHAKKEANRLDSLRREEAERKRKRLESLRLEEAERKQQREVELQRQRNIGRNELLQDLRKLFSDDFLSADPFFQEQIHTELISSAEYAQEKITFVKSWATENIPPDKNGQRHALDNEQARTIAAVHGHVQVAARAGSGKTATLVNRAYFLQKHCGVKPSEMMLLAFNKKAAEEIELRLGKLLDGQKPYVMTFHALAHALVHPEQNLIHDSSDGRNQALSGFVQEIVNNRLRTPEFVGRIRKVMLAHFHEDWDKIVDGGYHLGRDEMLEYRRSLQRETLRGEFVKSFGEKLIANILFEHQVPYLYEPIEKGWLENYHPDFILKRGDKIGVAIEYFGMAGDPDYDVMSEEKRRYWQKKVGWTLIEFTPEDITANGVDGFSRLLQAALEKEGFTFRRMTEDELWHQVQKRSIDRFTAVTRGFIARCRKLEKTPKSLALEIEIHKTSNQVEADFLDLIQPIFVDYFERLDAEDKEDFDGLMQRAANTVDEGQTTFSRHLKKQHGNLENLRYMLIDEYQDFSRLFHSLVESVRNQNPNLQLFCVGDDWQAINGFAGSDLEYYRDFANYFPSAQTHYISTNYRSSTGIVGIGNAVMHRHKHPAKAHANAPGNIWLADIDDFKLSPNEESIHRDDKATPMVLRIVAKALEQGKDVAVLSRTNTIGYIKIDDYKIKIRSQFPKDQHHRIKISTTHGFKGLQADVVIVLDAVEGCYPLIHQDWFFLRILGESIAQITDEARRLFYVALTRAKDTLVIFTRKSKKSPFLAEIEKQMFLQPMRWADFPYAGPKSNRLWVMVGNQPNRGSTPTVSIKGLLGQEGYAYQNPNGWPCWVKSFPNDDSTIDLLKKSGWSSNSDGVEVRVIDDQDQLVEKYRIDGGNWTEA